MSESETPLNDLPKNSSADSDLVNKILNQLDDTSATDIPVTEETPTKKIQFDTQYVEPVTPEPVHMEPVHNIPRVQKTRPPVHKVQRYQDENLPTPSTIQKTLQIFDTPEFYSKLKFSVFIGVLFFLFVVFTDNFKTIFQKLPIQTVNQIGALTNTGIFIQAFCFSLIHLVISVFLNR
tara:strand:+ start:2475 stop:3008 length:534 start_codon:yes stop_codon:yes gene_type:complete